MKLVALSIFFSLLTFSCASKENNLENENSIDATTTITLNPIFNKRFIGKKGQGGQPNTPNCLGCGNDGFITIKNQEELVILTPGNDMIEVLKYSINGNELTIDPEHQAPLKVEISADLKNIKGGIGEFYLEETYVNTWLVGKTYKSEGSNTNTPGCEGCGNSGFITFNSQNKLSFLMRGSDIAQTFEYTVSQNTNSGKLILKFHTFEMEIAAADYNEIKHGTSIYKLENK